MMPCGARLDHEWGKAFWEKITQPSTSQILNYCPRIEGKKSFFQAQINLQLDPLAFVRSSRDYTFETWSLTSRGGSPTISGFSLACVAGAWKQWAKERTGTREGDTRVSFSPARFFLCSLLPSACYAGQVKQPAYQAPVFLGGRRKKSRGRARGEKKRKLPLARSPRTACNPNLHSGNTCLGPEGVP